MFSQKECNLCSGSPEIEVPILKINNKEFTCDICISKEIQNINDWGLKTLNCCCGHGKQKPNFLCDNSEYNRKWLIDNNYKFIDYFNKGEDFNLFIIEMKTDVEFEQRIIIEKKIFKYKKLL